jgi:hypothetical protein
LAALPNESTLRGAFAFYSPLFWQSLPMAPFYGRPFGRSCHDGVTQRRQKIAGRDTV